VNNKLRIERRIAIAKDLILLIGGLAGIAYQTITGEVNIVLLAVFTAMTGAPGLTNLIGLVRSSATALASQSQAAQPPDTESENASSS
jgi:hypothetical protein